MELKVVCGCGQKYKFDIEPVNGRMPVKVSCPSCGTDGTATANEILSQHFPDSPPPIPVAMAVAAPPAAGPRINISRPPAPAAAIAPMPIAAVPGTVAPLRPGAMAPRAQKPKATAEFSFGLGILGAFIGAAVGAGLMYGFFAMTDFRFPLMGTAIGILTGLGARLLARGTESTLGIISGVIALAATGGTLYFMFGEIQALYLISMAVSVSFAYKIAS